MSRVRAPDGAPKDTGAKVRPIALVFYKWLVGQAVKTPASHAGNGGSIPPRVTTFAKANTYSSIAQSVEHSAVNRVVVGSSPTGGAKRILWSKVSIYYFPYYLFFVQFSGYLPNVRSQA